MLHQTVVRDHEFLQRRIDVVEVDVGNEAIDAGVDGRRSAAIELAALTSHRPDRRPCRRSSYHKPRARRFGGG